MGALDCISNFSTVTSTEGKRKPMQTVEIKVKMDCDGCERRVKHAVTSMRGVKSVDVIRKESRVRVTGHVDANKVLKRVKSTGNIAEFWPYIPYNLVSYPYATQAYDKRAPAGYVRNVVQAVAVPNDPDDRITSLLSESPLSSATTTPMHVPSCNSLHPTPTSLYINKYQRKST